MRTQNIPPTNKMEILYSRLHYDRDVVWRYLLFSDWSPMGSRPSDLCLKVNPQKSIPAHERVDRNTNKSRGGLLNDRERERVARAEFLSKRRPLEGGRLRSRALSVPPPSFPVQPATLLNQPFLTQRSLERNFS